MGGQALGDDRQLDPEPLYDHTVPRHPRLGLALLCSLVVLGGGQVVRGEIRRALTLWAGAIAGTWALFGLLLVLRPRADGSELVVGAWGMAYSVAKIYGIFDAMRAGPRVAPEALCATPGPAGAGAHAG